MNIREPDEHDLNDPTVGYHNLDFLSKVLNLTDRQPELYATICAETRELTGCQIAAIVSLNSEGGFTLLEFNPLRKSAIAGGEAFSALVRRHQNLEVITQVGDDDDLSDPEKQFGISLIVPLRKEVKNIGLLLALNLPYTKKLPWVANTLQPLAKVLSLVVLNAALISRQESVITERTHQLNEEKEKYRSIVDNSNDITVMTDPAGVVLFISHQCQTILGYPQEYFIGKTMPDIIYPPDFEHVSNTWKSVYLENKELKDYEYRIVEPAGTIRWIAHSISRLKRGNDIVCYINTIRDISAQKEAEEKIRNINRELEEKVRLRTAELETAKKEMESFNYSVSHDLRTPLRAIDGFANALSEDYAANLDNTARDYLSRIRLASQNMSQLIDDFLNLNRIGLKELDIVTIDLTRVFNSSINFLMQKYPHREIIAETESGLKTEGDQELLILLIDQLADNAFKFTAGSNPARIEFRNMEIEGERWFCITDNGAGFDSNYADKLFKPFNKLHPVRDFAGTGIGLAIARRIVEKHGGKIFAEGETGKGASIYFKLK